MSPLALIAGGLLDIDSRQIPVRRRFSAVHELIQIGTSPPKSSNRAFSASECDFTQPLMRDEASRWAAEKSGGLSGDFYNAFGWEKSFYRFCNRMIVNA